jgi:hypothetical protein
MMKTLLALSLLLVTAPAVAQITPGKISFALPEHPGSLSFDQENLKIAELSAKPNNSEFGVRAEDGSLHFLGFLFLWPEKPGLTAATCRDEMLKAEGPKAEDAVKNRAEMKSATGADIALTMMIPSNGKFSMIRAFVASGDLCGDLSFTDSHAITEQTISPEKIKTILTSLQFDPAAKPTFRDAFAYATVEWHKDQIAGSAKAYAAALKLVDTSDDPLKWRRVTADQLSMALGMSGDLAGSRAVNQAAIAKDPDYPLYYFNLACADAESGDAVGARTHLQQAFDRRANAIQGESFPDPTADDSIQKLKSNKDFWAFVEGLSKQLKKS